MPDIHFKGCKCEYCADITEDEGMDNHTATPWEVVEGERSGERRICTSWEHPQLKDKMGIINLAIGKEGAYIHMYKEDANFIVEACNNYDSLKSLNAELVEALRACTHYLIMYNGKNPESPYKEEQNQFYIMGADEAVLRANKLISQGKE